MRLPDRCPQRYATGMSPVIKRHNHTLAKYAWRAILEQYSVYRLVPAALDVEMAHPRHTFPRWSESPRPQSIQYTYPDIAIA